ncbi:MAG: glycosyltransferase [Terriglobus roseus]|nr:glycosyltransferase [Terriglobus roseus]
MTKDVVGWTYSIDEIMVENQLIKLRGWMTHPELYAEVAFVETILAGNHRLPERVKFGIPSPDVGQALGAPGSNARFAADHALPRDLSLEAFTKGYLNIHLKDGQEVRLMLRDEMERMLPRPNISSLSSIKVGLGITTYNRRDLIESSLDCIEATSSLDLQIVVANDGSTDNTAAYLESRHGITVINAPNRGISWNKNRALFYLASVERCDVIILIEDDVRPNRVGWDIEWALAACAYGHVNYAPPWFLGHYGGTGRWHKPYRSAVVSGQCSAFTAEALAFGGYLDTRFGKYGHEHVEHTLRMIRAGYGGSQLVTNTRDSYFLLMNGGLEVCDSVSSKDEESLRENAAVFEAIWNESIFRPAWRNDEEMKAFRAEMLAAQRKVA